MILSLSTKFLFGTLLILVPSSINCQDDSRRSNGTSNIELDELGLGTLLVGGAAGVKAAPIAKGVVVAGKAAAKVVKALKDAKENKDNLKAGAKVGKAAVKVIKALRDGDLEALVKSGKEAAKAKKGAKAAKAASTKRGGAKGAVKAGIKQAIGAKAGAFKAKGQDKGKKLLDKAKQLKENKGNLKAGAKVGKAAVKVIKALRDGDLGALVKSGKEAAKAQKGAKAAKAASTKRGGAKGAVKAGVKQAIGAKAGAFAAKAQDKGKKLLDKGKKIINKGKKLLKGVKIALAIIKALIITQKLPFFIGMYMLGKTLKGKRDVSEQENLVLVDTALELAHKADSGDCIAKLLCHLETIPEAKLSHEALTLKKALGNANKKDYLNTKTSNGVYGLATDIGATLDKSNKRMCDLIFKMCPLDHNELLDVLSSTFL